MACDAGGQPCRPALLWMDQRAFREAAEISDTGDPVLRYVSGRVSPEWMLPKALWLKRNEPEVYERADRIVECTDWMMYRLTGEWTLSLNHVAVKWNYARPDGGWPVGLLEGGRAGRSAGRNGPRGSCPLGKGEARLSERAAARPGPARGDSGRSGGDRRLPGDARPGGDAGRRRGRDRRLEHLPPRPVARGSLRLGGGRLLSRRDRRGALYARGRPDGDRLDPRLVSPPLRRRPAARGRAARRQRLPGARRAGRGRAAGAEGLVVRDDWQGNRSPYKNPQARGAIAGLSLAHGPGHVFRAIYEATACGTRHILEDASAHGLKVERIFLGGGGAKSALWLQIHADILKKPVHLARESEACALGSAMAAAVAAGIYPDFDEAARAMVAIERLVEPNPANAAVYDELFGSYVELYRRLNVSTDRP